MDLTPEKPDLPTEKTFEPRCGICKHASRAQIEHALTKGVSQRQVAKRFKCSEDALSRHWARHVPPALKVAKKIQVLKPGAALDELLVDEGRGLLENLHIIRAQLFRQFDAAVALEDRAGVKAMSNELHRNLELGAKATGELQQNARPSVTNIILSQDYVALRLRILQALRPFPDAARAVVAALQQLETRAEAAMTGPVMIDATAEGAPHG